MIIHPLWLICLTIRTLPIIFLKTKNFIFSTILLIISFGFFYKALTGSNNEKQFNKVFWHNTRIVHSITYFLAYKYLEFGKITYTKKILSFDILFSIIYRLLNNY